MFGRDLAYVESSCRSAALRSGLAPMPAIETARRDDALRAAAASAGRDGGTTCLAFVNTPCRISSVGQWCNAKAPSDVETRPHHARNKSVARMRSDLQFTFDPRLSQPLDYLDSCAPSIKVSLLWRLSIVVRMANNIRWHSEKAPPRVTGTSRHDS